MPKNHFLYFAYGSNMLTARLQERTPSARLIGTAHIDGYKLAFCKVSKDGSGKCDIEMTGNTADRVYGALFDIPQSEKPELDKAEGLGKGYREDMIPVTASGSFVLTHVYIATNKDESLRPYDWYKGLVVAGAIEQNLPTAYIEALKNVASIPDTDPARSAANEIILHRKSGPA